MKKVYALGFFDGVHLGHQSLLDACVELAKTMDAVPAAVTFDVHPQGMVSGAAPAMLNTITDRVTLLKTHGMEQVQILPFDKQTMSMPWREFFRLLTQNMGAVGLVCGQDFRFGSGGEGNARLLQQACRNAGIACTVVPEQVKDGVRISSTYIRDLIAQGEMTQACAFLGHAHVLTGTVVSGRKLGRTIGIPTANLELLEGLVVPRFGVYACKAIAEGREYLAVTNIGTRPTVGGHHVTVEPWLLDFDGDLYGKELTLCFYAFLRPERQFDSLEALKEEIQKNAAETRHFFEKN